MKRTKLNIPDAINVSQQREYTQVPNSILRNSEISLKAKGLLSLLLSNKEGWKSYIVTIKQMTKDNEEAIRTGVIELETNGYLKRITYRDIRTKIRRGSFWAYTDTANQFDMEASLSLLLKNNLEPLPNIRKANDGKANDGKANDGKAIIGKSRIKKTNIKKTNFEKKDITQDLFSWASLKEKYLPEYVSFTKWFLLKQKEQFPNYIKEEITPQFSRVKDSIDVLDKLCRINKFDFETEVSPILKQAIDDPFWAKQILSLASLRNKSTNGEIKFVNLMNTLSSVSKKTSKSKVTIGHRNKIKSKYSS